MSFRGKSAWAMAALILLTGLYYLRLVLSLPPSAPPQAQLGSLLPYVFAVVIASIAVQVALAIMSPREAQQPADERERAAIDRAGHWSGVVMGVVAIGGALRYLSHGQGNLLFQWVIAALILSQLAEYLFQIVLFRRAA